MKNVKSKPFFIINTSYTSSFTLYNILESFLLFTKHFLYQNFSYSNIWEVNYVIYFFQFLKQWKHEFVKYVKCAWKPVN